MVPAPFVRQRRVPRKGARKSLIAVGVHRTKLPQLEWSSVPAHALLEIKCRPTGLYSNQEIENQKYGGKKKNPDSGEDQVDEAFQNSWQPVSQKMAYLQPQHVSGCSRLHPKVTQTLHIRHHNDGREALRVARHNFRKSR